MAILQANTKNVLFFLFGAILASTLIYSTPLRYTDIIEPKMNDINASDFYDKFSKAQKEA